MTDPWATWRENAQRTKRPSHTSVQMQISSRLVSEGSKLYQCSNSNVISFSTNCFLKGRYNVFANLTPQQDERSDQHSKLTCACSYSSLQNAILLAFYPWHFIKFTKPENSKCERRQDRTKGIMMLLRHHNCFLN